MQNARIIEYYDKQPGVYFRLKVNGVVIGSNTHKDEGKPTKEEGKTKIEEFLAYTKHNDKIEIEAGNAQNLVGATTWITYQTPSGERESKSIGAVQGFGGNESSYQQGFNQGYQMGLNAGKQEAENKHILEKLATIEAGGGSKKGLDIATLAENLSGTEQGQMMLAAIMKKFGLLDA